MTETAFENNVKLFALDNPEAAARLVNLKVGEATLHSPDESIQEAKQWFSKLDLQQNDILYVYGIGLGYYYDAAAEWLHGSAKRTLIFLEDDLEIVHHFLETPQAEKLLLDPQVRFTYFQDIDLDWDTFVWLVWDYLLEGVAFSALEHYAQAKKETFTLLRRKIASEIESVRNRAVEDYEYGVTFFNSYYRNLLELPYSHPGTGLYGRFGSIPAIICGAGPSLEKQLPLLSKLEDKALIFAVGSAMNILNYHSIIPHFGATLDPYPEQMNRLAMNRAFEVPFFYKGRALNEGVRSLHGPKIFVGGSGSFDVGKWFEAKLGIPTTHQVLQGTSVVTFALSLVEALGCNPIIFVGMDFSDKDGSHYSSGIENHPLYNPPKSNGAERRDKFVVEDIDGKSVRTRWSWVEEAHWISFFAENHPKLRIINATEGGIGIYKVPNMPLDGAAESFLTASYDLKGIIHGTLEQAEEPEGVTAEAVKVLLNEFKDSLDRFALNIAKGVILTEEPAYAYLFKDLDAFYMKFLHRTVRQMERCRKLGNEDEAQRLHHSIEQRKNAFLHRGSLVHSAIIQNTLSEAQKRTTSASMPVEKVAVTGPVSIWQVEKESVIVAPSGQVLSRTPYENGVRQGPAWQYYSDGAVYGKQCFKDNRFDGRQEYYYPDGTLKTEMTYLNGKLDGTVKLYYADGKPKAELPFLQGQRHGIEKRWYENGQLFLEATYDHGKPAGIARCWLSDGTLAKQVDHLAGAGTWSSEDAKEFEKNTEYFEQIDKDLWS